MSLIIKNKKQYLTRFPFWLIIIVLLSLSPILIGLIGAWTTEFITGEICHEGNCAWMVLPWFGMLTIPIGCVILVIYLVVVLIDSMKLIRKCK